MTPAIAVMMTLIGKIVVTRRWWRSSQGVLGQDGYEFYVGWSTPYCRQLCSPIVVYV
jgi:hypothetical protein